MRREFVLQEECEGAEKGDAECSVHDNFRSCLFEVTLEKYGTRPWVMWRNGGDGDSPVERIERGRALKGLQTRKD